MIRWVLLAGLLAAGAARPAFAQETVKIGYVDLKRAVGETEDGRKATASLRKDFEQKQKELDERQEELRKAVEDLDKKRTLLSPDAVRQKEQEIQKKMQDAQQILIRHQNSLADKENQALAPILDRMQRIMFRIANTENFTMIFDKQQAGIVFAKPHLDLTNELIRRFNAGEGKEAGAGGGAAPAAKPGAPAAPAKPAAPAPAPKK